MSIEAYSVPSPEFASTNALNSSVRTRRVSFGAASATPRLTATDLTAALSSGFGKIRCQKNNLAEFEDKMPTRLNAATMTLVASSEQ